MVTDCQEICLEAFVNNGLEMKDKLVERHNIETELYFMYLLFFVGND